MYRLHLTLLGIPPLGVYNQKTVDKIDHINELLNFFAM